MSYAFFARTLSCVVGPACLVRDGRPLVATGSAPREKFGLFNLAEDPYEKKDLAGSMPERKTLRRPPGSINVNSR